MPPCTTDYLYIAIELIVHRATESWLMLAVFGDGFAKSLACIVGKLFVRPAMLGPYSTAERTDEQSRPAAFRRGLGS